MTRVSLKLSLKLKIVILLAGTILLSLPFSVAQAASESFNVRCWYTDLQGMNQSLNLDDHATPHTSDAGTGLADDFAVLEEQCQSLGHSRGLAFSHIEMITPESLPPTRGLNNNKAFAIKAAKAAVFITAAVVGLYALFAIRDSYSLPSASDKLALRPAVMPRTGIELDGLPGIREMTPVRADGDCGFYCLWAATIEREHGVGAAQALALSQPNAVDQWIREFKEGALRPKLEQRIEADKERFVKDINDDLRKMRVAVPASVISEDEWAAERNDPNLSPALAQMIRDSDAEAELQEFKEERDRKRLQYGLAHADVSREATVDQVVEAYFETFLNRELSLATFGDEVAYAAAEALGQPIERCDHVSKYLERFEPSHVRHPEPIVLYHKKAHYSLLHREANVSGEAP